VTVDEATQCGSSEEGADPVGEAGMPILRDFGPESPESVSGVWAQ
jgi:hypothetical protein